MQVWDVQERHQSRGVFQQEAVLVECPMNPSPCWVSKYTLSFYLVNPFAFGLHDRRARAFKKHRSEDHNGIVLKFPRAVNGISDFFGFSCSREKRKSWTLVWSVRCVKRFQSLTESLEIIFLNKKPLFFTHLICDTHQSVVASSELTYVHRWFS